MSSFTRQHHAKHHQATKVKKKRSTTSAPNIWDLRPPQQQAKLSFFDNLSVDTFGPTRIVVEDNDLRLLPPDEVSFEQPHVTTSRMSRNKQQKQSTKSSGSSSNSLPSAPQSAFKIIAYTSKDDSELEEEDSSQVDEDSQKENLRQGQKGKKGQDVSSISMRGPMRATTQRRERRDASNPDDSCSEGETTCSETSSGTSSCGTSSGSESDDDGDDQSVSIRALADFEAAWPLNAADGNNKDRTKEATAEGTEQEDPPAEAKDEVADLLQRKLTDAQMVVRAVLATDELGPLSAHEAIEEFGSMKRERDKLQQDLLTIQEEKEKLERSMKGVRLCSNCSNCSQSTEQPHRRRHSGPPQSDSTMTSSISSCSFSTTTSMSTQVGGSRTYREASSREISVVFENDESSSESEEDSDSSDGSTGESSSDDSEDESLEVEASAYHKHHRNKLDAVQGEMAVLSQALSAYKVQAKAATEKVAFLEAKVEQWRRKAMIQQSSKVSEATVLKRELQRVRNEKDELKIALGNSRKARRAVEKDLQATTDSLTESRKHCKEVEALRQHAVEKASTLSEELAAARQEVDDIKTAMDQQNTELHDMESDDFLGVSGPLAWMTTRQQ